MKGIRLIRQVNIAILLTVFFTVHSFVIFANTNKISGDLSVIELGKADKQPFVKVNGQKAATGRSIFSSSIVETNEFSGALISVGKAGKFQLGTDSKIAVSFDENHISANLISGDILILNAEENIDVKLPDGKSVSLKTGDKVSANSAKSASIPPPTPVAGTSLIPWIVVVSAALTTLVVSAAIGSNSSQASGNTTVVSPSS